MFKPLIIAVSFSLILASASSPAAVELVWTAQSSGVLAKLSGVYFADRHGGWVTGSNGVLLTTKDGGAKWDRHPLPERQQSEALNDVWFFTADRGLLLGEYALFNRLPGTDWSERIFLLRTGDGGGNWEPRDLARLPVKQPETMMGKKPGQGSEILKPGERSPDPVLNRMAFTNELTGYACGEGGTIQSTRDGGETWQMQSTPTHKLLYDVAAIDNRQACIVGAGGTVLRTNDAGRTWSEQASGVTAALRAIHFINGRQGWAVGLQGTIIATTSGGARWTRQTSPVTNNLNDVFFVNALEGWIAADRGVVLRTSDGGVTWENEELPTRANMARLFFIAPDCGWVVGTSGAIFKYGPGQNPQN